MGKGGEAGMRPAVCEPMSLAGMESTKELWKIMEEGCFARALRFPD